MFCSNCGKELKDDAKFCDGCGAKVEKNQPKEEAVVPKKDTPAKEGKVFKCPYCGEIMPYDAVKCPSCGKEIRGRDVTKSVQDFFDKYSSLGDDDNKKMELVKTFPIPNSREDIFEFMLFATSNFDAKYYVTNKRKDSLASAWLSKIEQCYQKAEIMFTDEADMKRMQKLYDKSKEETKKVSKAKKWMIIGGFVGIAVGLVGICTIGQSNTAVGAIFIIILAAAIVALVFGFKRKKTNKEIAEEKAEKARKEAIKKGVAPEQPQQPQQPHETVAKREYIQPAPTPVAAPVQEPVRESKPVVTEEPKVVSGGPVTYPREEIETSPMFVLRQGEKVILKDDEFDLNDSGDYEYGLVLTNQALYMLLKNDEIEKATRIPLCQISQCIYHKGFLDEKYIEIYREGATDKFDVDLPLLKRLPLWEMAINDRFDSATYQRDYNYYSKVNLKELAKNRN